MGAILREALERLEQACAERGREVAFRLFAAYYVEADAGRDVRYEDLARRFAVPVHAVKNRLAELRPLFRATVLELLRDGVSSDDELVTEIREVFGR